MTVRLVAAAEPEPHVSELAPSVRADRLAAHLWGLGVSLARIEAEVYPTAAQVEREVYGPPRPPTTGGTR